MNKTMLTFILVLILSIRIAHSQNNYCDQDNILMNEFVGAKNDVWHVWHLFFDPTKKEFHLDAVRLDQQIGAVGVRHYEGKKIALLSPKKYEIVVESSFSGFAMLPLSMKIIITLGYEDAVNRQGIKCKSVYVQDLIAYYPSTTGFSSENYLKINRNQKSITISNIQNSAWLGYDKVK